MRFLIGLVLLVLAAVLLPIIAGIVYYIGVVIFVVMLVLGMAFVIGCLLYAGWHALRKKPQQP